MSYSPCNERGRGRWSIKGSPRLFHGGSKAFFLKLTPNLLYHEIKEERNTICMISSRICREMLSSTLTEMLLCLCVCFFKSLATSHPYNILTAHIRVVLGTYPLPSFITSVISTSGINLMSSFSILIVINQSFSAIFAMFWVYYF